MTVAYLNGEYLPLEDARISPMDRGFLFGDGIYEVVPVHDGRPIGFKLHMNRMAEGLAAVEIRLGWSHRQWREVCDQLIERNGGGDLAIYLQVSRGADTKRHHAYPEGITPTVFGFASELSTTPATPLKISSAEDKRWRRCNIKSTALLGNIIHFQKGQAEGNDETLLYNAAGEITEGSASNAFIIKDGIVITPPLDHQVLPGITRLMLLDMLRNDGSMHVEERVVSMAEARDADEIWLTSSSRNVAPVVELDGNPVGSGAVGPAWGTAQRLFGARKFDY
ncbi:MAG: aminotransferase class IV [Woeseia sp.]